MLYHYVHYTCLIGFMKSHFFHSFTRMGRTRGTTDGDDPPELGRPRG